MNKRERIIELVNQITTARQQLAALEAELDSLLPPDSDSGSPPTVGTAGDTVQPILEGLVPGSMASKVVELLIGNSERSFDVSAIARGIGLDADKINSLRGTVLRLADSGRIQKVRRGTYRAKKELRAVA
jgi:hypothetical protein